MAAVIVPSILLSGAANTLVVKAMYSVWSSDAQGQPLQFQRPVDVTLAMFVGMVVAGSLGKVLLHVAARLRPRDRDEGGAAGTGSPQAAEVSYRKKVALTATPAVFNLLATGCLAVSLLYIPPSLYSILRGSGIVFTALFSMAFLGKEMSTCNWVGVACCLLGVMMAGLADLSTRAVVRGSVARSIGGVALVLASQIFKAAQAVVEELLIKRAKLPAVDIVLWSGLWPVFFMLSVVYPAMYAVTGSDHGHLNDPMSSVTLLAHSPELRALMLAICCTAGAMNMSLTYATARLSAIWRMMLDACRTSVVWLFGLLFHYCVDQGSDLGEAWSSLSYLELFGFLLVVLGQFVYGGFLRMPCARVNRGGCSDLADLESGQAAAVEPSSPSACVKEQQVEKL